MKVEQVRGSSELSSAKRRVISLATMATLHLQQNPGAGVICKVLSIQQELLLSAGYTHARAYI